MPLGIADGETRDLQMVLPPGQEDVLLCPAAHCLRVKETPPGFVGPRSAFHECAPILGWGEPMPPRSWGTVVSAKAADGGLGELRTALQEGYAATTCPQVLAGLWVGTRL